MINVLKKPHLFFLGLAILAVLTSFYIGDKSLDISVSYIYFVISYKHLCLFSAIFYVMIGINYFSLKWAQKPTKKWLTILHIILQIIAIILLITVNNWNWLGNNSLEKLNTLNDNSNLVIILSIFVFMLSLFVHLINFFTSLLLKRD